MERGSFTPLIFTTTGGMGPEATRYHKRVAVLLAEKRGEEYSHVMNFVRTKIRFSILKSTLIAIRGVRGKQRRGDMPISELSMNLIPERPAYEV